MDSLANLSDSNSGAVNSASNSSQTGSFAISHEIDIHPLTCENIVVPPGTQVTPVRALVFDFAKSSPIAHHTRLRFRVIQDGESTPEAFTLFKELVRQFCNDAKSSIEESTNTQRRVIVNNNDLPSVADDAQAIQMLFKRNRKRAIREILRNVAERCMISPTYIFDYFSTAWGPATSDPTYYTEAEDGRVEVLDRSFSVKEVSTKLKKADNTSPGPDRITYHHWRQIDPSANTLTTIFNLCLEFKKIPEDWKSATTILIPKDGHAADPRSLSLSLVLWRKSHRFDHAAPNYIEIRQNKSMQLILKKQW
ncbi:hypothetical protein AVEN_81973-1 [Araneus ventricosus]|uniref:Uncharacterized protein n=1 Tax=Araneus ventricosus TaxID=182803 RepID=A0A4Y2R1Z1_ARAVE|nr:hypothetical protein AVEN_81973-1 [Araneus ventricosus]